jgi:FlaA1/EpsC-like NDP-sugar epimerase
MVVAFLWFRILKTVQEKEKSRVFLFSGLLLLSFFLYLFLLYCLQIIIFNVGSSFDHTIGFSRYLNIVFSQIVFIIIIVFFHIHILNKRDISRKVCILTIGIVLLVLGLSRIEVYLHRENQDIQIQKLSEQIENKINKDINSIAIITGRSDNIPNLQFLYHLLPNKVDYSAKTFSDENQLIAYILKYDYVLLYNPESVILEWIKPYVGKENSIENICFFHVLQDKSETKRLEKSLLERVLL